VTNTGTAALSISSAVASGDFVVQTNNCTAPLQATTPPSNCTMGIIFTPTTAGASVGSLTLTDNAPNSPQIVLLTGTGVLQPAVSLSASSLSFSSQTVNLASAPQVVTVTNSGTAPLTFGAITATAPYAEINNCATVIAGGICTITVTFTPTVAGSVVGTITIPDNAANTPQTIALSGTGVTAPIAILSPLSVTFTAQALESSSAAQPVTLTNTGSATLLIGGIVASANFGATNNSRGRKLHP
jgi:hypothetical protein